MHSPFTRPVTCRQPHVMVQPSLPRRSAAKAGPSQSNPVKPMRGRRSAQTMHIGVATAYRHNIPPP